MRPGEKVNGAARSRHAKNGAVSSGRRGGHSKASIEGIVQMSRGLGKRIQNDLQTRPEALLIAVGGASFLAGAILGSRLGRLILSAAIPFGIQHLVESEVAPRLQSYVKDLMHDDESSAAPS
jgi:hypothetical protein